MVDDDKVITIELDIAEHDLGDPPGTGLSAMAWVTNYHCSAAPLPIQGCPGGTSYRVTGRKGDIRQLLTDGGYMDDPGLYPEVTPEMAGTATPGCICAAEDFGGPHAGCCPYGLPASQTTSPATWPYGNRD